MTLWLGVSSIFSHGLIWTSDEIANVKGDSRPTVSIVHISISITSHWQVEIEVDKLVEMMIRFLHYHN